jgi:hypothetical protein
MTWLRELEVGRDTDVLTWMRDLQMGTNTALQYAWVREV